MLNQLITKVKKDVNQSILLNSSKNQILKSQLNNSNSILPNKLLNPTDITNESQFLNITQEGQHNNVIAYNINHINPPLNKIPAMLGDVNESSQFNNTTF